MAKQSIGVGSASNDGTGDTLRQGAFKVNANFNEIYSVFGDASNLVSFAKTSGISSDSNKLGGQPASFYTDLTNQTSGSLNNGQLPSTISGKTFIGNLTGNVVGVVTGSLVGTASSSVRSSLAYGLTATPSITVNEITATSLTGNVIGDITGTAGYAHTAGLGTYAFKAGLSTDSERAVYAQLAGVSTIAGYATTAGIATLAVNAQGLTGSPDIVVGLATGTFDGDGSRLTGVVAASSGILIKDNDSSIGIAATVNFGYGATVSPLSAGIVTVTSVTQYDQLEISGVSTFTGDIKANGNITGDGNTVISGVTSAYVNDIHGGLIGNVITAAQPNITSLGTLTSLNVTGDVSIGGTLTYEDVTNIDSVGLITARTGIKVLAGGIDATGVVTATSFSGPLTGNADTATSAGTATTSSNANNIAVVDESTDLTCSVLYTNAASGYQAAKTGSNLTFDSVTGTLKPTNINATGIITASSFSGNATSATQATSANVASAVLLSDESSDTTCYPTFANSGIGTQSLKTGSNLYFNSNTGQLYATQFSGSGAGLSNIPASAITGGIDARPNFKTTYYTTPTVFSSSYQTHTNFPFSVTITPTNSNSQIWIHGHITYDQLNTDENWSYNVRRTVGGNATLLTPPQGGVIGNRTAVIAYWGGTASSGTNSYIMNMINIEYVDTPGTTDPVTYHFTVEGSSSDGYYLNQEYAWPAGSRNNAWNHTGGSRISAMEVKPN